MKHDHLPVVAHVHAAHLDARGRFEAVEHRRSVSKRAVSDSLAEEELVFWLERRFFGPVELRAVTAHRRFQEYLHARAFELRERPRKR